VLKQLEPVVFSSIVQSLDDALIVIDYEGKILFCNTAAETLFGYTEVERIIHRLSPIIPEEYRKAHEVGWSRLGDTEMSRIIGKPVEAYAYTKDGKEIPVELTITPLGTVKTVRDNEGAFTRFIIVARDISERKQWEEKMARLKKQYEFILTAADEGIFGFDQDGKATFVNPAAAMMLGYTVDEFVGRPQHQLIHHTKLDGSLYLDDDCPIHAALRDGCSRFVEDDVFWKKDGTRFPVQYVSTPIIENGRIHGGVVYFRDITEEKKMSEQLAHAVRIAGLGHWNWDVVNDRITLSDQMHRIFGLTSGEIHLTYANFIEFVHPDDVEFVQHELMNSLRKGTLNDCEWRIIRRDGMIRYLQVQGEVHFDTNGSPVRMIGTVQDITERKEQEWLLCASEQRYQSLVKYNPDGVAAFDVTGRHADVNEAYEKIFGYSKDELLGRDFREMIIFPEDEPLAEYLFQTTLNGESLQNVEFTCRRKDGNRVEVSITTAPIVVRGELVGIYAIMKDVTEQKLSRQNLMQSEERYRQLVESSLDAIGIHDGDNWLFMNGPGLEMFGSVSETDIIGKPVCNFLDPAYREIFKEHSRVIIEDKKMLGRTEYRWLTVDGRQIHSETIGIPIVCENKAAVQVIIRDITEKRRSEELLLQSEKLSAVGQLAAGVAHEIRNPLTALKGFAQLLESSCMGPKRRYLDIMQNELDRIEVILNELLILAKPQAVKFSPQPIGALLQEVTTLLSTQAVLKNVVIESSVDPHGPMVNCEQNQLKQVFVNIIKNAIEAMPRGGRLSITARTDNEVVCIQFTDEGEGIPEDLVPKLGEPFFTTKEKGTGLGLLMSHKIILAHQGTIDISSVVGKGTTVSIVLPVLKAHG
jgi:two-component system sporulation sensor kinase A